MRWFKFLFLVDFLLIVGGIGVIVLEMCFFVKYGKMLVFI